jgi:probable F420-dependent oxidoreductase
LSTKSSTAEIQPERRKEWNIVKVGVVINHSQLQASDRTPAYSELRDLTQAAEAGGLDSIWLFDHLLFRFDDEATKGIWECWTLLSALAEATNRVELGTIVLCNPFRNPALLAKMAHTLDEVSGGRLILGIGAGWHQPEFEAFGYSFDRRVDRLEEALQILNPLLHEGTVDFKGTHYEARDCVITPLGPRTDGIPLLVGAFRPRMLRLAARYADMWNTAWLGSADELADRLEQIRNACAGVGRDPATLAVTVGVDVALPDLGEISPLGQKSLSGPVEDLARAFHEFEQAGVAHLIVYVSPFVLPAMERVAEAVRLYQSK